MAAARRPRIAARADERERVWADVACGAVKARELALPVLVAGDASGLVRDAVVELGLEARAWLRHAGHAATASGVSAWPPDETYGTIVARVPRDRASFEMNTALFASRLAPEGALLVYGPNDEGVRSAPRVLGAHFDVVELADTRRRARVYEARRPRRIAGGDIGGGDIGGGDIGGGDIGGGAEEWRREITVDAPAVGSITLLTYPGVFARDRLDDGTRLLLEAVADGALAEVPASGRVLDFACGHGVVARVVRALHPDARLALLDADALAIEAARANVPDAEAMISHAWAAWPDDAPLLEGIVSNPPFHVGRAEDFSVFEELVVGGARRLSPGGVLLFVAQRTAGAGRLMKRVFPRAKPVRESTRYQVWRGVAGRG